MTSITSKSGCDDPTGDSSVIAMDLCNLKTQSPTGAAASITLPEILNAQSSKTKEKSVNKGGSPEVVDVEDGLFKEEDDTYSASEADGYDSDTFQKLFPLSSRPWSESPPPDRLDSVSRTFSFTLHFQMNILGLPCIHYFILTNKRTRRRIKLHYKGCRGCKGCP